MASESLPSTALLNDPASVDCIAFPAKTVISRVRFAIIQWKHGPHALETGALQQLLAIKRAIPVCQIQNIEVERAIGSRVIRWRHPRLILQYTFVELVAHGPVGDDFDV